MAPPSNNTSQSAAASSNNTTTSNTNRSGAAEQTQEVSEATKLKFAEEKSLLKTHPPPKSVFKDRLKGSHWEAVMHIHWTEVHSLRLSMHDRSFSEYHGMLQVFSVLDQATEEDRYQDYKSIARMLVVCPICFNNPSVSLYKSLIGCGKGSSSNIKQHWTIRHKDLQLKPETNQEDSPTKKKNKQSTLPYGGKKIPTRMEANKNIRYAIYCFINDLGLPTDTVTKEVFRDMLDAVRTNAVILSRSDFSLSTKAVTAMRIHSYNNFVQLVAGLMSRVRSHYATLCGKSIPFATIAHDVWNGKKKDILGITVMFCDPRNCLLHRIPIGMVKVSGHTAAQVSAITKQIITTYGMDSSDLSAAVNDNTNSAVLASKYITGRGGKCDMHKAELILKHATGLCTRSRNKQVVDSNPGFVDLYKKFHTFASWLMSRKAKGRFESFKRAMAKDDMTVIEVPLPGTTRVAGCLITFQALIRNKWAFDEYFRKGIGGDQGFKDRYPTQEEWDLLSLFEGILNPLQTCSMTLQSDLPAANSASLLMIFWCRKHIQKMQTEGNDGSGGVFRLPLSIGSYAAPPPAAATATTTVGNASNDAPAPNTHANMHTHARAPWDARSTMKDLAKLRKKLSYGSLHIEAKRLIVRILKEFKAYVLEGFDKDAEKALFGNPLLVGSDVSTLLRFLGAYKVEDIPRLEEQFINDMSSKHSISGEPSANSVTQPTVDEEDERVKCLIDPNLDALDDDYDMFKTNNDEELGNVMTAAPSASSAIETLKKQCRDSYFAFVKFCRTEASNWTKVIMKYPTADLLAEMSRWKKEPDLELVFKYNCKKQRYLPIAKYFDVMLWWKDHANMFPKVFTSAVVWLTKPATNAFQERAFSRTSWFDSNQLMRRQSCLNFEMRTVESLTRNVRKAIIDAEKQLEEEELRSDHEDKKRVCHISGVSGMRLFDQDNRADDSAADRLVALRESLAEYDREDTMGEELPSTSHVFLPDNADTNAASSVDLVEADEVQVLEFFTEDWTEDDAMEEVYQDNATKDQGNEGDVSEAGADGDELLLETLLDRVDPIHEGVTPPANETVDLTAEVVCELEFSNGGDENNGAHDYDVADGDSVHSHANTIVTNSAAGGTSSSRKRTKSATGEKRVNKKQKTQQPTTLLLKKKPAPKSTPKSPKVTRNSTTARKTPPRKAKTTKTAAGKKTKKTTTNQKKKTNKEVEESSEIDDGDEDDDESDEYVEEEQVGIMEKEDSD